MDKYLTVILIFMVMGIPIAFITPTTGEIREDPLYLLFYGSIGGIIVIMFYGSYKEKKEREKADSGKRRSKR